MDALTEGCSHTKKKKKTKIKQKQSKHYEFPDSQNSVAPKLDMIVWN